MNRSIFFACLVGLGVSYASTALAQATANAVTGANDAFGFRNGDESIGIYDESSVRGFNLESAGNFRMNGTYFVRNSGVSSFFLENTTVRVGYNTLATILPGPSGVVDYQLRDPKRAEPSSLTIGLDYYGQPYSELHLKNRATDDRFSYSLGFGKVFNVRDLQGGNAGDSTLLAGTARVTLGNVKLQGFFGEYIYERSAQFRVIPSTDRLPPLMSRGRFLGQDWAREKGQRRIAGLLVDAGLAENFGVGATLVFSQEDPTRTYSQFFSAFASDGTARARVVAIPQQRSTAWSGEIRAHWEPISGKSRQRFDFMLRLRSQQSRYGGGQLVDLGRTEFGLRPNNVAAPILDENAATLRDRINQEGVGLSYRATIGDRLKINVGLLRTNYRRTFIDGEEKPQKSDALPLLYNVGLAWQLSEAWELYGSYNRGLEEAGVAPASATNRNQVLNAIEVTQKELGVRLTPLPRTSIVLAVFDTSKPYAGLDNATNIYRFFGSVRHRGVEGSLTTHPIRGLTLVLGGVLLDPKVHEEGGTLLTERRPVGVPKLRAIANIDYQLPSIPGLSIDAGATLIGSRAARSSPMDADGHQLTVPAIETLNLGLRYRFNVAKSDLVIRFQVQNLLNQHSWDVNGSETLNYSQPRRFRLVLTTLF